MEIQIPKNSKLDKWPSEERLQTDINEQEESYKDHLTLRFDDLSLKGQRKLCHIFKMHSPLWSLKKPDEYGGITLKEMYHALRISNPVIFNNWQKGFCYGSLPRNQAERISQIIYYLCRRKPTRKAIAFVKEKTKTYPTHIRTQWGSRPDRQTGIESLNQIRRRILELSQIGVDIDPASYTPIFTEEPIVEQPPIATTLSDGSSRPLTEEDVQEAYDRLTAQRTTEQYWNEAAAMMDTSTLDEGEEPEEIDTSTIN